MTHYSITSTCHELYEMIDKVTRIVPWINTLIPDHRISVVIHSMIRISASASEVTTAWRYRNSIITIFKLPSVV